MSNRYSLSQTDSPLTAYRAIDHSRDDEPALHPATLPGGAPHPSAGKPVSVVTSPAPASYRVQGEGRARTWGELGGYTVAIIEQAPHLGDRPRLRGPPRGPPRLRRDPRGAGLLPCRRPGGPLLVRHPHRRPTSPAFPLAGPLRGRLRPRAVAPPRAGAPRKLPVSLSGGRTPAPRYLHLGTGALARLRSSYGLPRPLRPAYRPTGW